MCFPREALPPSPPIAGAAVDSVDLVLEAADGNRFAAFGARTDRTGSPGVVVLPDVRGLFRYYEELALRFAEAGVNAVTIDYFGRTAGVGKRNDPDWAFREHVMRSRPETIAMDTRAAVEYLRSGVGGSCPEVFTVGFCFGGSNSWNQAAAGHGLSGAIGFYGHPRKTIQQITVEMGLAPVNVPETWRDIEPTIARVPEMTCPILALQAGNDHMMTGEDTAAFKAALDSAGIANEFKTYDGAPHSFFDRSHEEWADASADAWTRVLGFIRRYGR